MTATATPTAETPATAPAEAGPSGTAVSPPDPAPAPAADVPLEPEGVQGADALQEALAGQSGTIGSIVDTLDAYGFTVGDTRFSLWSVLVVVLVIIGVIVFARIATSVGHTFLGRFSKLEATQKLLGEKLLTILIWAFSIMIGIDILGVDLTALAVFSGAFGLAIGFGLQKTFGNLIAGIILLMDRSIKPGDVIAIADQAGNETFGQIRKIGIRAVSVTTRDQREYLIPNENLMINQVENWSYSSKQVRVQVTVGVSYGCDMKLVQELMLKAAAGCKRVLENPKPSVWMNEYGDSSVNFTIHCWITDPEDGVGNIKSDVLNRLWNLFEENNVEIPFPQRDINLRDNAQFQQLVSAIAQRVEKKSE